MDQALSVCSRRWNVLVINRGTAREACPSDTVYKPAIPHGLCDERLAASHLSHAVATKDPVSSDTLHAHA